MYLPKRYKVEVHYHESKCGYIAQVRRDGEVIHTTRPYLLRMDAVANARVWAGEDWQVIRVMR